MNARIMAAADRLMDLSSELHPDTDELAAAQRELADAEDDAADRTAYMLSAYGERAEMAPDEDDGDRAFCKTHGWQQVTDAGSNPGFAGGGISWWTMACGCYGADESADLRAAE
jgi:hypothetical protein